jgi:hypothetical protein
VALQSALIADAVLADAVPELLRSRFTRLRTKHVSGGAGDLSGYRLLSINRSRVE